jgi:hypothetical protein
LLVWIKERSVLIQEKKKKHGVAGRLWGWGASHRGENQLLLINQIHDLSDSSTSLLSIPHRKAVNFHCFAGCGKQSRSSRAESETSLKPSYSAI